MERVFSGRTITESDIETMRYVAEAYPALSRQESANTVCELIGWTTPAGGPKSSQCMACFDALEAEGLVRMPALKKRKGKNRKTGFEPVGPPDKGVTQLCGELSLSVADGSEEMLRWRSLVNQHHMLGHSQEFGSRLRYFIKSGGEELGCVQFSASAWALDPRDKWIGWDEADRKARLHLVANNSRFLILPWVRVPNLASMALSQAARRIKGDWLERFGYEPVLLETFVDTAHFRGTCYKAANWTCLGETKGRGRMDRYSERALTRKAIYAYPLRKDFRRVLCGELPPVVREDG
jgi:hypothetical protein